MLRLLRLSRPADDAFCGFNLEVVSVRSRSLLTQEFPGHDIEFRLECRVLVAEGPVGADGAFQALFPRLRHLVAGVLPRHMDQQVGQGFGVARELVRQGDDYVVAVCSHQQVGIYPLLFCVVTVVVQWPYFQQ